MNSFVDSSKYKTMTSSQSQIASSCIDYFFQHKKGVESQFNIPLSDVKFAIKPLDKSNPTKCLSINLNSSLITIRPEPLENYIDEFYTVFDNQYQKDHIRDYLLEQGIIHEMAHIFSANTPVGKKLLKHALFCANLREDLEPVVEPTAEAIANIYLEKNLPASEEKRNSYISMRKLLQSFTFDKELIKNYYKLKLTYEFDGINALANLHDKMLFTAIKNAIEKDKLRHYSAVNNGEI